MKTCEVGLQPCVVGRCAVGADKESKGPHGMHLHHALPDDTLGEDSYEKAECAMFSLAVRTAIKNAGLKEGDIDCLVGGDLLNQLISANYAARDMELPFLGLYGACSTMTESLIVGTLLVGGGFAQNVVCAASSHFSTAERQYRLPLEMGSQRTPTAQRTVTGAGATVLSATGGKVRVTRFTIGRVVDLGITDSANMGAAMAPAACDTIARHFKDTGLPLDYYDYVYTGDLGTFGHTLLHDLLAKEGIVLGGRLRDCGCEVYHHSEDVQCGGSGCGCAAITLNGYLLAMLERGDIKRLLILATGALMSTTASQQGESIPGIAHAVALEVAQ